MTNYTDRECFSHTAHFPILGLLAMLIIFSAFKVDAQAPDELTDDELEDLFEDEDMSENKDKEPADPSSSPKKSPEPAIEFGEDDVSSGDNSGFSGEKLKFKSRLADQDKSLYAAFALSFFVGFGSGNFYAGNIPSGYLYLMLEILATVALGAGVGAYYADPDANTADSVFSPVEGVMYGTMVLFATVRMFDVISAVSSAHKFNQKFRFKYSETDQGEINPSENATVQATTPYPVLFKTDDGQFGLGVGIRF